MAVAINNYPKKDGHRVHYAKYAIQRPNGKWVGVDVTESGYIDGPWNTQFDSEGECQKGIDIHNDYHGWTRDQVMEIVGYSMMNSDMNFRSWPKEKIDQMTDYVNEKFTSVISDIGERTKKGNGN